jgi:hypothetical protein
MANPAGAVSAWPGFVVFGVFPAKSEKSIGATRLRRIIMHAVIRKYTASSDVIDEARPKFAHLEQTMRGTPGFVAYYFLETDDGLATVTVTEDKSGATESVGRAADWVKQNMPNSNLGAPVVMQGATLINATR